MWPSVIAGGLEAVSGLASGALSYFTDKNLARQSQANTQKNMRLQSDLEQQSIRNSTANLRAAGLNPALATGATPVNVTPAASPIPNGSGRFNFGNVADSVLAGLSKEAEIQNVESATEVNEANADKLKEETREKRIENAREESRDRLVGNSMNIFLDEMKGTTDNPFIRGYIEAVQSDEEPADIGTLKGFSELFFDFSQRERDRELDYIAKEMDKEVLRRRLSDDESVEALVKQPYDERVALYKRVALANMQIYSLASEASLTEDKRELIRRQIDHLAQDIRSLYHRDPAAMYEAGDTSALLMSIGHEGLMRAADGFGFGAGAAVAGRLGGRPNAQALKTRLDVGNARAAKQTEVFRIGFDKAKREQPKQLKVARLRKELEQMRSNERYFKPEVYRKKLDELMRAKYGM